MRFLFKPFDDQAVVFDTASGDTHALSPFAWRVFQTLCTHPASTREALADHLGAPHAADGTDLESTLASLRAIELLV